MERFSAMSSSRMVMPTARANWEAVILPAASTGEEGEETRLEADGLRNSIESRLRHAFGLLNELVIRTRYWVDAVVYL